MGKMTSILTCFVLAPASSCLEDRPYPAMPFQVTNFERLMLPAIDVLLTIVEMKSNLTKQNMLRILECCDRFRILPTNYTLSQIEPSVLPATLFPAEQSVNDRQDDVLAGDSDEETQDGILWRPPGVAQSQIPDWGLQTLRRVASFSQNRTNIGGWSVSQN